MRKPPLKVGDVIVDSPVGPGKITGFTALHYPEVNKSVVTWLIRADGKQFNLHRKQPHE